jgi:hypothetical protein
MSNDLKKYRRAILVFITLNLLLFAVGCSKSTTVDNTSKVDTQDEDSTVNYLCFTAQEAGSTITLNKHGEVEWEGTYSTDAKTWNEYTLGSTLTLDNEGDKIYFKGTLKEDFHPIYDEYDDIVTDENGDYSVDFMNFTMTGKISASGNLNSLHYENDFETRTELDYEFEYYKLFADCTCLTTAPELPATTLTNFCYAYMFYDCVALTTAPEILPATTLNIYCYYAMFSGCSNLTTTPELPAITLTENCYAWMFENCVSLTTTPELPATTLAERCYCAMFEYCVSLTTTPELSATELDWYCYTLMFSGCSNLTTLPKLHINSLAYGCCALMFSGCTKIKLSTVLTDEYNIAYEIKSSDHAVDPSMFFDMFLGTGGTFTGTPDINTRYYMAK